jgi:processive 1,2-diacylglycerol beta-glucosyltransferase
MAHRGSAPFLVVSASAGGGHISAGNALRDAFSNADHDVEHVDVLDLAPRWVRVAYGGGFEMMARRAPRLWKEVYEWSDGPDGDVARWGPLAHRLLFRGFRRLLLSRPWAACVCTHFLPGQLAAGRPGHPPFAMVITDFALHRYWVQPRVNRYFVASSAMAAELQARLPAANVTASGIPIAPAVATAPAQSNARRALGIGERRRVALVMGGGLGIGVEEAALGALSATVPDLQVIAVCGRNNDARAALQRLDLPDARLRVLGYVNGMTELMAAADVIISKPGGLTCSEALAMERPLILTRAIPGHEEANVRFLTASGAATSAPEPAQLGAAVDRMLGDATSYDNALRAARTLSAPHAAAHIAGKLSARHAAPVAA